MFVTEYTEYPCHECLDILQNMTPSQPDISSCQYYFQ